jgi:hypothetical protein
MKRYFTGTTVSEMDHELAVKETDLIFTAIIASEGHHSLRNGKPNKSAAFMQRVEMKHHRSVHTWNVVFSAHPNDLIIVNLIELPSTDDCKDACQMIYLPDS